MAEEIKVQKSSGNVFADLGLANPDELLVKAELARQISKIITQTKHHSSRSRTIIRN